MIAIVCRNSDGVQALKTFGIEGAIDRNHVQQGHGSSAGRTIDGRFQVICLADIRYMVMFFICYPSPGFLSVSYLSFWFSYSLFIHMS